MNKLIKISFMAAVLMGTAVCNRAEAQEVMNLKECMEYAVSNSTKMRIQQADNDDARVERRNSILEAFTPYVSAGTSATASFGRSVDPETNTYSTTTSFYNPYSVSAGIDLFNGFNSVNNMKISKTAVMMGIEKSRQIEDEICLATMEAYYNVVYYTELEKILRTEVEVAAESLRKAQREEELGRKGHADVVQMAADLADREYQLISTANKLADAYITLRDIMFYPMEQELRIDLEEVRKWDGQGTLLTSEQEPGSIIAQAKSTLPAALIAQGNMANAKLSLHTAKWQLAPRLSLYGGWSTSYFTYPGASGYVAAPFASQFSANSGEYVQISLSIPIYDRLSRKSNVTRKKNAYIRASAQYDQTMQQIEAEVLRAVADRDGASAAYLQSQKRAAAQKEAFTLNRRKFEHGLISPIEYQTSSNNMLTAQAERLNALLQFLIKRSVVEYYRGVRYIEQEW